jgi:large subunit ribosomal protein L9
MKVVLLKDDKVVNVADGYARNYLIPKKLATLATKEAIRKMEERLKKKEELLAQDKKAAEELSQKIKDSEIIINVKAGDTGKLFGSITSADIVDKIKETLNIEVDKNNITLNEPIKNLGVYTITVEIFQGVSTTLKLYAQKE